jgi:hypothetical protein
MISYIKSTSPDTKKGALGFFCTQILGKGMVPYIVIVSKYEIGSMLLWRKQAGFVCQLKASPHLALKPYIVHAWLSPI